MNGAPRVPAQNQDAMPLTGAFLALGVDAVWTSSFLTSSMCYGGYDMAERISVDPRFDSLEDFDRLVDRARDPGPRVTIGELVNLTRHFQMIRSGC